MELLVWLDGGVDLVPAVVVDLPVEVETDGPELLFVVRPRMLFTKLRRRRLNHSLKNNDVF
jgi:hypothetical protein